MRFFLALGVNFHLNVNCSFLDDLKLDLITVICQRQALLMNSHRLFP